MPCQFPLYLKGIETFWAALESKHKM